MTEGRPLPDSKAALEDRSNRRVVRWALGALALAVVVVVIALLV